MGQQLVVNVLEHPEEAHEEVTSAHWTKKMFKCALCRILGRKRGGGEEEKEWKNRRRKRRRRRRRRRRKRRSRRAAGIGAGAELA